jgi:hypothetical protein
MWPTTVAPMGFRTKSGKYLSDADIQALADEAEQGYCVEVLETLHGSFVRRDGTITDTYTVLCGHPLPCPEHTNRRIDVVITLLPTDRGGRWTPITSGYRPSFDVDGDRRDAAIQLAGRDILEPGASCDATLTSVREWPDMRPGDELGIYEGRRRVGTAVVR